jgi:small nuclear ribonucleoprotein
MSAPPVQLLERALHQKVTVLLKDNRTLTGRLLGCDEHMNLVLDEVEEATKDVSRRLGRVVVRGSNLVTLYAASGRGP